MNTYHDAVITATTKASDLCTTTFSFKTNGFQGGDTGHGGYLEVVIKDEGGTAMGVVLNAALAASNKEKNGTTLGGEVTLRFTGDAEMRNFAKGIDFLAEHLYRALYGQDTPREDAIRRIARADLMRELRDAGRLVEPKA